MAKAGQFGSTVARAANKGSEIVNQLRALSKKAFSRLRRTEGTGNLTSKIEINAADQIAKMESGTPGAHYFSRHGAQTTLDQQYIRATTGVTPDGFSPRST